MPKINKHFSSLWLLSFVLLLSACAAKPVLLAKSPAVPEGVDLSGSWQLRDSSGAARRAAAALDDGIRIPSQSSRRQSAASNKGSSVHVFIEYGRSLKLTQTPFGLFISYDRSVVEEYRFGENREIEIGPIVAQRVSGWSGNSFVVETLDDTGTILYESWQLTADKQALQRDIRISRREEQKMSRQEIYDRR